MNYNKTTKQKWELKMKDKEPLQCRIVRQKIMSYQSTAAEEEEIICDSS